MNVLTGNTVAQLAHIGFGGLLCYILRKFIGPWKSVAAVAAFAALKESAESFGIAPWEPKQPWGSSTVDFAFFLVGIGAFLLFTHIKTSRKTGE